MYNNRFPTRAQQLAEIRNCGHNRHGLKRGAAMPLLQGGSWVPD